MNINFNLLKIGILLLSAIGSQAQPSIGGFNVYYGHLHNHSNVSDGNGTPDEAYNYAKNSGGLDFFSLSDHSTAIDATEWLSIKTAADKYNSDNVFTAFYGFEWTENVLGHVTVINSTDYISTGSPTNTFAGLCNWLNNTECVAFFNHPGRNNSTGHEFEHFTTTPTDKIAGMELWNKAELFPVYYYTDGYYAADGNKSWFDEAISRGWKIGAAGGEDNHSGTWGTAGNARLAVLASAKNRTDIYNALKAKRFFTTYDKNLALSFKIGANEMGSTITSSETSFSIEASDGNGEIFNVVQILKNGVVLNTWTPNTSAVNISGNMTFTTGEYYYVRVKQTDNDEAISSPIWIGNVNQLPSVSLIAPLQNSNFVAPAAITISATASDTDGNIQKVEFYQGATKIGEDTSSPYSFEWSAVSSGSYSLTAKAFDNIGGSAVSTAVQIVVANPGDPVTIFSKIATGMDDMEESSTGNILANVNSTDIELVNDISTSAGIQTVGLRFINLNIPQGALISNAYIQFTCDEISTDACNLTISGENVDNSAAFTTANFNISNRTKTTARVNWVPSAWSTLNEAGINQRTPNISTIIQEIVWRTGYVSTGAISLIFNGTGARITDSYNGSPAQAAVLYVTYTIPTVNQPPVVSITNPLNNATFTAPATILISANATDIDGSISKVDFFQGSTFLGSDNTRPFIYNWTNVIVGTYSLTAVATDNLGTASTTSSIVSVTVNPDPVISNVQTVNITETSASINWTTDLASSSEVQYGITTSYGSTASVTSNVTSHSVPLTGLTSGTLYHYRVLSNGVYSGDYTFTTQTSIVSTTYSPALTTITTGTTSSSLAYLETSNNVYYTVNSTKVKPYITDWYGVFQVQNITDILRFTVKYEGRYSRSVNQVLYLYNFNTNSWVQIDARSVSTTDIPITSIQNAPANFVSSGGEIRVRVYATTSSKSFTCLGDFMQISVDRAAVKSGHVESSVALESIEEKLILYPIPVFDILNIELQGIERKELNSVEILNIAGIRMKKEEFSGIKTQLNLFELPSGIYFVKVKTPTNMYLRKIIRH